MENGQLSRTLRKVTITITSRENCRSTWDSPNTAEEDSKIGEWEICGGNPGKDSCGGDSGGPLKNEDGDVVGLVSWGPLNCGNGSPAVYTRIASHLEFIRANM
jgi:secreted trypsin-like serine protease